MRFSILFSVLILGVVHGVLGQVHGQSGSAGKTFVLGLIEELPSKVLQETRILNIYLPEGYRSEDTARYPVVYLLDGAADEDFIHVVGLYQFNNFSWIDRVPKSIIVGIANVDRKRDFTFKTSIAEEQTRYPTSGHSDQFRQFIALELQPFIQSRFRCNSSKTIIGQSLAGLFVAEVLLKQPTLFDQYICISPSIWWDNGSLLQYPTPTFENSLGVATIVYIGVGKEGLAPSRSPHIMEEDAKLLYDKLKVSKANWLRSFFDYLPEEDHASITHQAVFNALRFIYPKKSKSK